MGSDRPGFRHGYQGEVADRIERLPTPPITRIRLGVGPRLPILRRQMRCETSASLARRTIPHLITQRDRVTNRIVRRAADRARERTRRDLRVLARDRTFGNGIRLPQACDRTAGTRASRHKVSTDGRLRRPASQPEASRQLRITDSPEREVARRQVPLAHTLSSRITAMPPLARSCVIADVQRAYSRCVPDGDSTRLATATSFRSLKDCG